MKYSKVLPLVFAVSFANQSLSEENKPSKFFTGVQLGVAQHTIDVSGQGANYEEESGNSFSPDLSFGYKLNDNWSIVAQYISYGEADLFNADIPLEIGEDIIPVNFAFSTDTTGLGIAGQFMTTRNVGHWGWGAKLGLMKWDTDFNIHYTNSTFDLDGVDTESDSGVAIYGGFIGAYTFSEKLDFTMGIDWFVNDLDVEIIEGTKTDMQYSRLSAGINYHW